MTKQEEIKECQDMEVIGTIYENPELLAESSDD